MLHIEYFFFLALYLLQFYKELTMSFANKKEINNYNNVELKYVYKFDDYPILQTDWYQNLKDDDDKGCKNQNFQLKKRVKFQKKDDEIFIISVEIFEIFKIFLRYFYQNFYANYFIILSKFP